MMFWCTPPQTTCEWHQLKGFVSRYNDMFGTSYARSACLDVENRVEPEPELLLESQGAIPIVVEHKSVAWPVQHLPDHNNEHVIADALRTLLSGSFQDDFYVLTLKASSLAGQRKSHVKRWAQQIAEVILLDRCNSKSPHGVRDQVPIFWRFGRAHEFERDYDTPDAGIEIRIMGDGFSVHEPSVMRRNETEEKQGYKAELERLAGNCKFKFEKYGECRKLLLLQFYGGSWSLLEDDLVEIINSARLPDCIDEVWLGQPDWLDDDEYETKWDPIRRR